MSDKHKFTVNRAMQDGAKSYERGDTREMTEIEAAPLLAAGALSKEGEKPAERKPAVQHTFGAASADELGVQLYRGAVKPARKAQVTGGAA